MKGYKVNRKILFNRVLRAFQEASKRIAV